jgi:Ser/Thr protein kinase RdoA (MazF antagonist)
VTDATPAVARALHAAIAVAREHGVACTDARILSAGANVIAWLYPAPVVARVAAVTAVVRARPEECLARDIAVAGFCASRGAAVVAPSNELPPGPHEHEGRVITFWDHVEHEYDNDIDGATLGRALVSLHEVLRDYDAPLPYLSPALDDALEVLARIEELQLAPAGEVVPRRAAVEECRAALEASTMPTQVLHGDAHRRNALATRDGIVWTDFEDTCCGPIAWDLATLEHRSGPLAMAAYGELADRPSDAELAPFIAARTAQGSVWELVWRLRDAGRFDEMPGAPSA